MADRFVEEGEYISPLQGLFFGGTASAIMSTTTYPLLLARTKMQTQGTAGLPVLYDSWVDSLRKTVNGDTKLGIPRGGAGALFAGLNGSLLKFIPATAVQFMVYGQVLAQLQKL
jgi:hypothetical protein